MKIPNMFWLLMVALLLAPLLADAQNENSMRLLAETEVVKVSTQNTSKIAPTTGALSQEQSASILKLKDGYQPPKARNFQWTLGFRAGQFQPQGTVVIPGVSEQSLGDGKASVMPSVSLGSLYSFSSGRFGNWQWGLEGSMGLASQNVNVQTAGPVVGARINSSFVDGQTLIRWGLEQDSRWHISGGIGYGRLTMNQTSDESLVRWSKSADYRSVVAAADYRLTENWQVEARNRWQRPIGNSKSELVIPGSSFELGAKVIW
jgi:hypothetical protein